MGAWGEGMQANDHAMDWIAKYQNFDAKGDDIPLNRLGKEVIGGKRLILKELQGIKKSHQHGYSWAQAVLGVAEFFLDLRVDLKPARGILMQAIKNQLSKGEIETWCDMKARRDAIKRFKERIDGKVVDPKLIAKDNEGLFSRMGRV